MPLHLRPSAPIAADALLPGDPGRALLLAQSLLDRPRMSNHARGLWGYYGVTVAGRPLTIQSTGIGGPSAAIVLTELADLGVRRAVRVGTCGALDPALALGDLLVVGRAIATDGASRALGAGELVDADPTLTAALRSAAGTAAVTVATADLFYEPEGAPAPRWRERGAVAVEMEAASLFAVGRLRGIEVGCVLAVSDLLTDGRRRIDDEALAAAAERMGGVAAKALA